MIRRIRIGTFIACALLAAATVGAQVTFQSLSTFPADGSSGSFPIGVLTPGPDGNFYGVTYQGGVDAAGAVYRVTPDGVVAAIASFHVSDGAQPDASVVVGPDGQLYGTTSAWATGVAAPAGTYSYGPGTIFAVTPAGSLANVLPFTYEYPYGGTYSVRHGDQLTFGSDGAIYGTFATNNINCAPACDPASLIYKIAPGGSLMVLHVFSPNDVFELSGLTLASDGYLYGTALEGGGDQFGNAGTIYRLKTDGTGFEVLHAFNGATEGYSSGPVMQASDGALYGMTEFTVFKIDLSGAFSIVSNKAGYGYAQPFPPGRLVDRGDGYLYGVIMSGADGFNEQVCDYCLAGAVVRIDPHSGAIDVLHQFHGADGAYPTGLALGADGNLYGATSEGGPCTTGASCGSYTDGVSYWLYCTSQCGTIFRISGLPSLKDTTAPTFSDVPGPITVEGNTLGGAVVTYAMPVATDADDAAGPVACAPAPGSTFPLGPTTVTCSSIDTHGNTGTAAFTVTVVDTTAPVLALPSPITVDATSASGAVVAFATSATDVVDGNVAVACTPASGTTFAIGTTTVGCTAVDESGNVASGSFTVTVRGPADIVRDLIGTATFDAFQRALRLLTNASASIRRDNTSAVCGQLDAFFRQVAANGGRTLTAVQTADLKSETVAADVTLGCRLP